LLVLQAAQGGSLHPGGDADNDGAHLSAAASVVKHVQYTEVRHRASSVLRCCARVVRHFSAVVVLGLGQSGRRVPNSAVC
jgi:hypothetical protein